MSKIVIIGDSHSQLFDNNINIGRGSWISNISEYFDIRWLGPKTMWRLCRDKEDFINFKNDIFYNPHPLYKSSTKCDLSDDIIISLGEIDIRCNIYKVNVNYVNVIDNMINELSIFIDNNIDYKLHFISIPPPIKESECISKNSDFPFLGSDEIRKDMTIYFNEKIKELSLSKDKGYIDIYSLYNDDGYLDIYKSDKIVHCTKNIEFENYIKNYFKINENIK